VSNIALIGATGNIGSRVLEEALSRQHTVTAITRDPRKVTARAGMVIRAGSTTDAPALVKILKGHDIVVVSVKWNENDVRRVIDTIRKSGVKRALFVVGAGSLLRKDGKRHYDYMSEKGVQPPTSLPALQAYEEIQKIDDLDWTAISPPASSSLSRPVAPRMPVSVGGAGRGSLRYENRRPTDSPAHNA